MTIKEILATVRRVEIRTFRMANDMMVGAYLSRFKGRGMDFEELREYIPGDDVRDIDWNVTNRMGRPFVKRHREERELGIVLAVDVSASGAFGSVRRSKREFAAEVAATLAFSAARSSDKVGLALFTDRVELFLPPRKGRRHILRVIREMLFFEPRSRATEVGAALRFLNDAVKRRSVVFLLTDFVHSGVEVEQAPSPAGPAGEGARTTKMAGGGRPTTRARDLVQEIGLTNTRHDLVCLHLHDPREGELPNAGLLTIEDAETGELLEVDSGRASVRAAYAETNASRIAALDRSLQQAHVDTLRLRTDEPFAQTLQRFFELRRRR
ncbi:MAG: DUF58 domain-containing protein [Verrucomicrobia bacterium]|nr:DUF58 domain-containing protein [Verrucomicrobiota bacterium]